MQSMPTNTPNPKHKPTCQLTQLVKGSDNKQILGYSYAFNNNILIYSTHVQFNNGHIVHDRNSYAYAVHYGADVRYAFIFVRNPAAIQVLNMTNGDMLVGRGLEDLANYVVVGISMQKDEQIKTGQQSRRIYMLLEYKGATFLKVLQIQPKIDNNPKTRQKPMDAHNHPLFKPFFSTNRWNVFICCLKQGIQCCRPRNKNDEIEVEFTTQALENKLSELYRNNWVMGMGQTNKTWALLCSNKSNSREQSNFALNIFWQHFFANELTKNMYYRDDAFIKTVTLPCPQNQFIKMWQYNEFYAIQTKGKQFGSHRCYLISECNMIQHFNTDLIVINLSQNSTVCQYSIDVNPTGITICQIINKIQLNRIKYCLKAQNAVQSHQQTNSTNPSTQTSTNTSQSPNTQTTNPQTTTNNQVKFPTRTTTNNTAEGPIDQNINEDKNKIKRFQPISEPPQQQKGQQGKLTVRKNDPSQQAQQTQPEQTKNLLNPRLVEHLEKADNRSNQSSSIEAPTTVERLVSFGVPGETKNKPKQQIPNVVLASFGPGQRPLLNTLKQEKSTTSPTASPSTANLKQQKNQKQKSGLTPAQIKQARQIFNILITKMNEELKQRQQSFKDSYECLSINQLIKFESIFTQRAQGKLKNFSKTNNDMYAYLEKQEERRKKVLVECVNKLNKIKLKLQRMMIVLQINALQNVSQFKAIRKLSRKPKIKQFSDTIQENLNQADSRISKLQLNIQSMIQKYSQLQAQRKPKLVTSSKLSTKQIFKLFSNNETRNSPQKVLKIPIFRQINSYKTEPLHKLIPL